MGYTTIFGGKFYLDKPLDSETYELLWALWEKYDTDSFPGEPPNRYESWRFCQWIPTEDRMHIEWDGGEKFYKYLEWINYINDEILIPRGYILSGSVSYQGEDDEDFGAICFDESICKTINNSQIKKLVEEINRKDKIMQFQIDEIKALEEEIDRKEKVIQKIRDFFLLRITRCCAGLFFLNVI